MKGKGLRNRTAKILRTLAREPERYFSAKEVARLVEPGHSMAETLSQLFFSGRVTRMMTPESKAYVYRFRQFHVAGPEDECDDVIPHLENHSIWDNAVKTAVNLSKRTQEAIL